jgi:hypothetical protein
MNEKINIATKVLHSQLSDIMGNMGDSIEGQRTALRIMFTTFTRIGAERNLPIMKDTIVSFILSNYPHLKDDLDKLLILT